MDSNHRLSNAIKNVKVAWVWQMVYIFFKFFTRRYFTMYIDAEYLGLESLFSSIMGLMNLAELGLGTAIGFALYKPLAERNEREINGIMQLMARIYRYLALFIFFGGMVILPFITKISPEAKNLEHVHVIFCFYIASTCASYLFGYKSVLLTSDQKRYIHIRNHYTFMVSLNAVQIVLLITTRSFLFYAFAQCAFAIAEGISISRKVDHHFSFLNPKKKIRLPKAQTAGIAANVRQIAVGRIGYQIIGSTDNLVLTNIVGLASTGIYNNYYLVMSSLLAIVRQFPAAVTASVGNLVANDESEKEEGIFWQLMFINTSVFTVTCICLINLIQPFIAYWVGGNYLLDVRTSICIAIIYYITGVRDHLGIFRAAHGAFRIETWKAILEAVINLSLSVVLALKFGLLGVVLGTIISALLIGLPMELYNVRTVLRFSVRKYICWLAAYTGVGVLALYLSSLLCSKISMHWYIRLPGGFAISVAVFALLWVLFFGRTNAFRETLGIIKALQNNKH